MAKLYLLAAEYNDLVNALLASADEETGEVSVDIAAAVDKAQGSFEEKAVATATVHRILNGESEKIGAEIKRLQALKKRVDNEADRVKKYLADACERVGLESIRGMYANISFRASEQTVIDNPDKIPKKYLRIKYEPDKTKIKEAIKSGLKVAGAHVETVRNIQIK